MNGRTCVGCRARADRSMLLRVVLLAGNSDGTDGSSALLVVPDVRGCMPGRGAWLHRSAECLDQAIRRRAFARALRATGQVDVTPVTEWFTQQRATPAASPRCDNT